MAFFFRYLIASAVIFTCLTTQSQAETFNSFVAAIWPDAKKQGIDRKIFNRATAGLTVNPKLDRLTKKQPEFASPIGKYFAKRVSKQRLATGRRKLRSQKKLLSALERKYGVDPYVVAAIWGLETNYGGYSGKSDVFRALATLAYKRYREDFFRDQFIDALKIMQQEKLSRKTMIGSWAGGMGQTQFIPSSFLEHAVDFDRDGKRNLWTSVPDALGSTANYLKNNGWVAGQPWGYPVMLPKKVPPYAFTLPWDAWAKSGVKRLDGRAFPKTGEATLFFPAGHEGQAFLVTPNYEVIKSYNFSDAYALSVARIADRLRGYKALRMNWPTRVPLTKSKRMKVQSLMVKMGRKVPNRVGKIEHAMRMAIRDLQLDKGWTADGHPDAELLKQLGG